jgi:hypothetical protein
MYDRGRTGPAGRAGAPQQLLPAGRRDLPGPFLRRQFADGGIPGAACHLCFLLSKAYGVPGISIGWIVTTDPLLQETFLAAKEQVSICGSGSTREEWIAERIFERRKAILDPIHAEMRRRRVLVADWIANERLLDWVPPSGGVVCFPLMRAEPPGGTNAFYGRCGPMAAMSAWALVRDARRLLQAGLLLADRGRARGRTQGDLGCVARLNDRAAPVTEPTLGLRCQDRSTCSASMRTNISICRDAALPQVEIAPSHDAKGFPQQGFGNVLIRAML